MPDPSNKAPPRRKGVQLKKDTSVKVHVVPKDELPDVTETSLSVKPSGQPIKTVEQEEKEAEDTSTVLSIFGVGKPSKSTGAPKAGVEPEKEKPAPKKINLVSLLPKSTTAPAPPARAPPKEEAPKGKPSLLPPVEEESAPAPSGDGAAPPPPPPPPPAPEPSATEAKPEKKARFKISAATAAAVSAQGSRVKPTLDGYTLTAEEEELLSNLTDSEFNDLAKAIMMIEKKNPYKTALPADGYVPENRTAFSDFVTKTFNEFKLALPDTKADYDACTKMAGTQTATMYQYQEFVRDYMRWQSPYRGLLIYHGLGSGKTCSAIAAAEALFSQGNRRIIVLTPASLQQNFLKEISFCGFEHFRLNNNWIGIPKNSQREPLIMLFAEKVLKIPKSYLSRADVNTIWIPDFRKRTDGSIRSSTAFKDLNAQQQQQIREQIENIVFRVDSTNPKKRRDGRIQFISYNGISKEQLRSIASKSETEGGFDNAVIIIDEIHNLIRNMQGQIDPFLIDLKTRRKKITFDPITYDTWKPKQSVSYPRGILFYRLLVGARNSKIIGLSGTPIINFPEEVGILMNVLHGYNHVGTTLIQKNPSDTDATLKKIKLEYETMARAHPFCDFFEAEVNPERGVQITATMLPEGIRKIEGKQTVERIPMGQDPISFPQRFAKFEQDLRAQNLLTSTQKLNVESYPLLPPTGEKFDSAFGTIENDEILLRRMSGLVSYYKGSRKDLMPEKSEEIVTCPMSLFAQKYYIELRSQEMVKEEAAKKKKKRSKGVGSLSKFWSMAYDIEGLDVANSYRVATRQACNFAFPKEVRRPRPKEKEELRAETGLDPDISLDDIGAELPEGYLDDDDTNANSLSNTQEQEEANANSAQADDDAALQEEMQAELAALASELQRDGITEEEVKEIQERIVQLKEEFEEAMQVRAQYLEEKAAEAETQAEESLEELQEKATELTRMAIKRCQATKVKEKETYRERIERAMHCLRTVAQDKLVFGSTLPILSSKYEFIIQNILKTSGSSLLYSNYLSMEGLGIFTMILDMLGWKKIVIERSGKTVKFSDETIADLTGNKGKEVNRYIYFTGGEDDQVRKAAINVFNMNRKDLPGDITSVLDRAGFTGVAPTGASSSFTDNKQGKLCRLFCITSAGAEGLSLQNVRAVHIMEPHWNDVRMAQVKGRAIRICSHKALEPKERNVKVYTYISTFDDLTQVTTTKTTIKDEDLKEKEREAKEEWVLPFEITSADSEMITAGEARKLGLKVANDIPDSSPYYITTDVALLALGALKKETSDRIQRIMKMGAVDCELNKNENLDGTYTCINFKGGDFLYHPNLDIDISRWSKFHFSKVDLSKKPEVQTVKTLTIKGVPHILKPVYDPDDSEKILYFEVFLASDRSQKTGEWNVGANGKNPIGKMSGYHVGQDTKTTKLDE